MIRSFLQSVTKFRSLYLQLLFVTLAFTLMVVSSGIFVNNMVRSYLRKDAEGLLAQTMIRIEDELREPNTLMISIVKSVRNIILDGGTADDVQRYFDELSVEILLSDTGFYFDGLHGYFDALGGIYLPAPGWTPPEGFDARERPWYITAVEGNGKIVTSPMFLSMRTGEYIITIACRIFDNEGVPLGAVAMNVPLRNISRTAANAKITQGGYGFLANENFEIVAHPTADFITMNMRDVGPGFVRMAEYFESGVTFISELEDTNYRGDHTIFFSRQIENGWYLGVVTPKEEYYSDFTTLVLFLSFLGAALMVTMYIILIRIDKSRSKADKDLLAAKEAAEESNRSKGVFLAQMSHEVRTPMNAILGISEIQMRDTTLTPEAEDGYRKIYESGNLLLNIINDILDFSKIDAGKLEIVPDRYDIPSLLNDTVLINRMRYESKPLEFDLRVDEKTPLELIGDEMRIRQILNNLLSNAFKYTDEGEVGLSITAEPKDDDNIILVFEVSDTGQGMTKDQIDVLFDEYTRFNIDKNSEIAGTGLGMNITKRLLDMMNGEMHVESEPGKGSVFTVRLPQKTCGSALCGTDIIDRLRNFTFHNPTITKKVHVIHEYMPYGRVLIVDDVESNLYVARGMMIPYGLQVDVANSGYRAIELIKKNPEYDIIFMDHMMPKMDGIKATRIIHEMGYKHPVIALTANAVVGQAEMFLENGFDDFIAKPIDSRRLDMILKHYIRDVKPTEVIEAARLEEKEIKNRLAPLTDMTSELGKHFVYDAESTVKILQETVERIIASDNVDMPSFITAVHGIKSALANIGELKLSASALKLEQAGADDNLNFIESETPALIDSLNELIGNFKVEEKDEPADVSHEDMSLLLTKLYDIKLACEAVNLRALKSTLKEIKEKAWPENVSSVIDEISVYLLRGELKNITSVVEKALTDFSADTDKDS